MKPSRYLVTKVKFAIFLVVCALLTELSESRSRKPSLVRLRKPKLKAEDECIRTSQFIKPRSGVVCKKLGQCYKYRCGAIARHCSSCGDENKGPCIDYSEAATAERSKRSQPEDPLAANYSLEYLLSSLDQEQEINTMNMDDMEVTVPTHKPVRIETIGNAVVHLRAGDSNCAGFVASINGSHGRKFVVMTAAQCVINFDVECFSERTEFGNKFSANTDRVKIVDGFMTYQYNHSSPCFGDYDAEVTKVTKGFRSYVVVVTSYTGSSFTIPLNEKHVIIPREYMECQDCRNDFAAIKISDRIATAILRGTSPFLFATNVSMDWQSESVPNFITVKSGQPASLLRRATDVEFCTVSHTTEQKMCFSIPLPPMGPRPNLLAGSPIFLPEHNENGELEYKCVGIFTGMFTVFEKNFSTIELKKSNPVKTVQANETDGDVTDDAIKIKFSSNGAVRITSELVKFVRKLSGADVIKKSANAVGTSQTTNRRRDCYKKLDAPMSTADPFCLCALGWTNEGAGCTRPVFKTAEGCDWAGKKFACAPRMRRSTYENARQVQSTILKEVIIPGTTTDLDLRGQRISDVTELKEMLRHIQSLQNLILDYNELEALPAGIFDQSPELRMLLIKHNKIRRINSDIFRRNLKLSHLNLANNQIVSLPVQLLQNVPSLQYVNLQDNNIARLSPNVFLKNTKLSKIYLGNNKISHLSPKLLKGPRLLREIWLGGNQVGVVSGFTFSGCPQLTLVDLSHNKIATLPKSLFLANKELMFVNLNYNNLTSIPMRLFARQRQLKSVSLSGNPLKSFQRTRAYLRRQGITVN